MYPLVDQLTLPTAPTRKYRPLPPRPLPQHSRDHAVHHSPSPHTSTMSYTDSALRSTVAAQKHNDTVHTPSRSENSWNHTPSPNALTSNQTIFHDQWKRLSFIGKGSYGQVYRALDITTGDIFAVKEVDSKNKRKTIVQALQDERETLKELEHPNIVHYLGFEEDQGVLNIFLEYVPGGTIRSCLNTHGKFKEDVTKSFARQILKGLSYLHSKSILHRDLKSENILVEPRGICKISDFGISKKALDTDRGRLYSTMKGTVAYMAPEMIDNKKKGYDSKIDIWSVGCIVFEMWTGTRPWSGRKDVQILMKLCSEKLAPPLPPNISLSTTAESFRQESFHFDPEIRPSAINLLQHAYLKLAPQWVFPGVDKIGQVSDTSQNIYPLHVSPYRHDIGTETSHSIQEREELHSLYESVSSELEAIVAELNFSSSNCARRSLSPARSMYSDVMDPRAPSPPLIILTPRKQRNLSNKLRTCTITSLNSCQEPPLEERHPLVIHPTNSDDAEDTRETTYSERQTYVYQPPPLPEINISSPYSRRLAAPLPVRFGNPISQAFIEPSISTSPSTDASSISSSLIPPNKKVDYSVGQRKLPLASSESNYSDDSDESYSPSAWKRPPVDIPSKLPQNVTPVELVSDWEIPPIPRQRHLPSAIPRPSVETVYKGFLSEEIENIDVPDVRVPRTPISGKTHYTMKSIREVVEERLYHAQTSPAQSPRRGHFWDSHMEEIKV